MPLDDEHPISPEFKKRAAEWDAGHNIPIETRVKKEDYDFRPGNYPKIATSAESKELKASRAVPVTENTLDIGGAIQQGVWTQLAHEAEQRIQYIDDKLEERALNFERNFDNAREDNEPDI